MFILYYNSITVAWYLDPLRIPHPHVKPHHCFVEVFQWSMHVMSRVCPENSTGQIVGGMPGLLINLKESDITSRKHLKSSTTIIQRNANFFIPVPECDTYWGAVGCNVWFECTNHCSKTPLQLLPRLQSMTSGCVGVPCWLEVHGSFRQIAASS